MVKLSSTEEEYTEFLSSLWATYKILIIIGLLVAYYFWKKRNINQLKKIKRQKYIEPINIQTLKLLEELK